MTRRPGRRGVARAPEGQGGRRRIGRRNGPQRAARYLRWGGSSRNLRNLHADFLYLEGSRHVDKSRWAFPLRAERTVSGAHTAGRRTAAPHSRAESSSRGRAGGARPATRSGCRELVGRSPSLVTISLFRPRTF
jgi:hypothetical protein